LNGSLPDMEVDHTPDDFYVVSRGGESRVPPNLLRGCETDATLSDFSGGMLGPTAEGWTHVESQATQLPTPVQKMSLDQTTSPDASPGAGPGPGSSSGRKLSLHQLVSKLDAETPKSLEKRFPKLSPAEKAQYEGLTWRMYEELEDRKRMEAMSARWREQGAGAPRSSPGVWVLTDEEKQEFERILGLVKSTWEARRMALGDRIEPDWDAPEEVEAAMASLRRVWWRNGEYEGGETVDERINRAKDSLQTARGCARESVMREVLRTPRGDRLSWAETIVDRLEEEHVARQEGEDCLGYCITLDADNGIRTVSRYLQQLTVCVVS
jgi:hypothetical protein